MESNYSFSFIDVAEAVVEDGAVRCDALPATGGVPTSLHAGALASLSGPPGQFGNPAATGMKLGHSTY